MGQQKNVICRHLFSSRKKLCKTQKSPSKKNKKIILKQKRLPSNQSKMKSLSKKQQSKSEISSHLNSIGEESLYSPLRPSQLHNNPHSMSAPFSQGIIPAAEQVSNNNRIEEQNKSLFSSRIRRKVLECLINKQYFVQLHQDDQIQIRFRFVSKRAFQIRIQPKIQLRQLKLNLIKNNCHCQSIDQTYNFPKIDNEIALLSSLNDFNLNNIYSLPQLQINFVNMKNQQSHIQAERQSFLLLTLPITILNLATSKTSNHFDIHTSNKLIQIHQKQSNSKNIGYFKKWFFKLANVQKEKEGLIFFPFMKQKLALYCNRRQNKLLLKIECENPDIVFTLLSFIKLLLQ